MFNDTTKQTNNQPWVLLNKFVKKNLTFLWSCETHGEIVLLHKKSSSTIPYNSISAHCTLYKTLFVTHNVFMSCIATAYGSLKSHHEV